MPISEKEGLYEHAGFLGLRNTVPTDRFDLGDLEVAQNVDIDDSQRVTRRYGHGAAVVSGDCHSLWSDGITALVVRNNTLARIHPNYSTSTLRSGLTPGQDMSFGVLAHRIYYSNGIETGVVEGGRSRSWGLEIPGVPVAAVTGGVLPAGRYQFAVTYLRSDGQESGSSRAGIIDLSDIGGISLSAITVPADPDAAEIVVYFSKCNGDMLYRAGTIPNGSTAFSYQIEASMQIPMRTQHLRPAPAGQFVDVINGRTLVARGDTLYISEPYAPELFDLRKNFRLAGPIVMLAALDTGVFVGTEARVIWLDGSDPEKWVYSERLTYGAIRGASTKVSRDQVLDGQGSKRVVVFATKDGICLGEDGGATINLTHDRYAYPVQDKGTAVVRKHRGMVQCLVALQGTEQAGNVSS